MEILEVDQLVKEYGRKRKLRALNGVSLQISRGEIFGLLGPNGAGKTTFVKCVLGLLNPTSGSIRLLGGSPSDATTRSRVGFASEVPQFPGFLSAPEVMRLHSKLIGLDAGTAERQLTQLLLQAELDDAPRRVREFSKGMVRRLALAQAMLGDPEFLVLDEPTADLDPLGRRDVRNQLEKLKQQGKTVLLNSHLLSEVERLCDRAAIVHRGEVIAEGTMEQLVPEGQDLESVFVNLIEGARR